MWAASHPRRLPGRGQRRWHALCTWCARAAVSGRVRRARAPRARAPLCAPVVRSFVEVDFGVYGEPVWLEIDDAAVPIAHGGCSGHVRDACGSLGAILRQKQVGKKCFGFRPASAATRQMWRPPHSRTGSQTHSAQHVTHDGGEKHAGGRGLLLGGSPYRSPFCFSAPRGAARRLRLYARGSHAVTRSVSTRPHPGAFEPDEATAGSRWAQRSGLSMWNERAWWYDHADDFAATRDDGFGRSRMSVSLIVTRSYQSSTIL